MATASVALKLTTTEYRVMYGALCTAADMLEATLSGLDPARRADARRTIAEIRKLSADLTAGKAVA